MRILKSFKSILKDCVANFIVLSFNQSTPGYGIRTINTSVIKVYLISFNQIIINKKLRLLMVILF